MKKKYFWMGSTIFIMTVIFYFSHQNAVQSSEVSSSFLMELLQMFHLEVLLENQTLEFILTYLVRKSAHFVIYFCLGIGSYLWMKHTSLSDKAAVIAFFICFVYSCSDELHQVFIPGRSGQVSDVLLDSFASLCSIIICGKVY